MKKLVKIKEIGRYEWGKNFKNKNLDINTTNKIEINMFPTKEQYGIP